MMEIRQRILAMRTFEDCLIVLLFSGIQHSKYIFAPNICPLPEEARTVIFLTIHAKKVAKWPLVALYARYIHRISLSQRLVGAVSGAVSAARGGRGRSSLGRGLSLRDCG
jgi:hypothetical protein